MLHFLYSSELDFFYLWQPSENMPFDISSWFDIWTVPTCASFLDLVLWVYIIRLQVLIHIAWHYIIFFKITLFVLHLHKQEIIHLPMIKLVATFCLLKLSCHSVLVVCQDTHWSRNLNWRIVHIIVRSRPNEFQGVNPDQARPCSLEARGAKIASFSEA